MKIKEMKMKEISWERTSFEEIKSMFYALQKHMKKFEYEDEKVLEFDAPKQIHSMYSIFKIKIDEDTVGFCSFAPDDRCKQKSVCYLSYLYVKKNFRNHGIGTQIIKNLPKMFEEAYKTKLDMMFCSCETNCKTSIKFLEKFGFKPTSIEGYIDFREKK